MLMLLVIIYLAFISLGLPDSLLGCAWPAMQIDLQMPLSAAGLISIVISSGTIISSLMSSRVINRFGTGKVTTASVCMTAIALFGFALSHNFWFLCVCAIPLGLGAGSVDAALNNFVAINYKAIHMNWLHCFWGVGAALGPMIMSHYILINNDWEKGYLTIAIIQISLFLVLACSLVLWKKYETIEIIKEKSEKFISNFDALHVDGVKTVLVAFTAYSAAEFSTVLWGSSFLEQAKGFSVSEAAKWISLFYIGISIGRFLSGILTIKFSNSVLIRAGQILCAAGALLLIFSNSFVLSIVGFIMIGFGFAPIYPCMLHETPTRFSPDTSQALMGLQMAFAYVGSTFMPPIVGLFGTWVGIKVLPVAILIIVLVMLCCTEKVNKSLRIKGK